MTSLEKMVKTTNTDYWNDSCAVGELSYALHNGAVGCTTNPVIVGQVLKKELALWESTIRQLAEAEGLTEIDIAWRLIEALAMKGAEMLLPVFHKTGKKKGWLSIQTNAQFYRNTEKIIEQGLYFHSLAPNIQVKIPATAAGIQAIEELTARGVNINATVCFTLAQALAVAEAVEKGLARNPSNPPPSPVCTIMIGRVDDWLHVVAARDGIPIDPTALHWGGIAVMKSSWQEYQKRNYHTRLLCAAYRHLLHWTELVGGNIIHTIPHKWQKIYNTSGIEVKENIQEPIPPHILQALLQLTEFRKACEPDGLSIKEFDGYGATVRTLRQFNNGYADLLAFVRDRMLINPDA